MQPQLFTRHEPLSNGQFMTTEFAASPPRPLYDFSGLGKLSNDAGFVREMQQMFVERVPGQVVELRATIEEEDWLTIAQRAHSLKATFGNLRIEPGTALLKELECIAFQHRDKLEMLAILKVVATAADAVVQIFRQELSLAA